MTDEKKSRVPAVYLIETWDEDHQAWFGIGEDFHVSKAAALSWLRKNPTTGPTRIVRVCWSGTPVVENKTVVRLGP